MDKSYFGTVDLIVFIGEVLHAASPPYVLLFAFLCTLAVFT